MQVFEREYTPEDEGSAVYASYKCVQTFRLAVALCVKAQSACNDAAPLDAQCCCTERAPARVADPAAQVVGI